MEFQAAKIYHQVSGFFTHRFSVASGIKPLKIFVEFHFFPPFERPLNPLLLMQQTLTLNNSLNVIMFNIAPFIVIFCLLKTLVTAYFVWYYCDLIHVVQLILVATSTTNAGFVMV
jgi:hypothetical protein